jgi:hypothetical protein
LRDIDEMEVAEVMAAVEFVEKYNEEVNRGG